MIEFLILMLLPPVVSLMLYYALKSVDTLRLKLAIPIALFMGTLFLWFLTLLIIKPPDILQIIALFSIIAFAVACPVSISMSIFRDIFSKRGEAIAAFLTPFLSIPFIFALLVNPEMYPGQPFPADFFWLRLPLCGWAIDLITFSLKVVLAEYTSLAAFLGGFGFFVEMLILMLFLFGWLKCVSIADKRREQKRNDEK